MNSLKYKNFLWIQEPESLTSAFLREPEYEKNASTGLTVFAGMGPQKLTITGNGAFSGENAYTWFQALATLFADADPGTLVHPVLGNIQAYLTGLEATQEPRADYVAYRITFREADSSGSIPK